MKASTCSQALFVFMGIRTTPNNDRFQEIVTEAKS
jgi:hypothetical protein